MQPSIDSLNNPTPILPGGPEPELELEPEESSSNKPFLKFLIFSVIAISILTAMAFYAKQAIKSTAFDSHEEDRRKSNESTVVLEAIDIHNLDAGKIIDLKKLGYNEESIKEATGGIEEHVRGNKDSEIVLVEYADFQCPGCAGINKIMSGIFEEYQNDVAFVFRNYPLEMHELARHAARAAEAAGEQNAYWQMNEYLFERRLEWMGVKEEKLAEVFGTLFTHCYPQGDKEQFIKDYKSDKYEKKIDFDLSLGQEVSNVSYTPYILINGKELDFTSAGTYSEIEQVIRKTLDEQLGK